MKSTPGPWEVHTGDNECCEIHPINDEDGFQVIADIPIDGIGDKEANARLIASAPDLLEACQEALDVMNQYIHRHQAKETFEKLEQAIAKTKERKDEHE